MLCDIGVFETNIGDSMANHRAANAFSVAGGAASGALPGFLAGGPIGAGIGALIGGGLAGAQNVVGHRQRKKAEDMAKGVLNPKDKKKSSFWNGEQARTEQLPLHNPEQAAAMKALLPGVVDKLGGNQFDFAPIEEKSRRDFQKYTVPSLANRFSAFGGGTSTDAYQQALASAHGEHETGLAGLKSEYGLKQQTQQQNLLNTLLQPAHQNLYFPQQPGFGQRLAEGLIPQAAGALIQHGIPALIGAGSSYFGGNKQQPVPTMPQGAQATAPTIGAASTPQGQAAQALAQSSQPVSQLGGAGANVAKSGLSTAGKVGLGLGAGAGGYALTQYFSDLLRRG